MDETLHEKFHTSKVINHFIFDLYVLVKSFSTSDEVDAWFRMHGQSFIIVSTNQLYSSFSTREI